MSDTTIKITKETTPWRLLVVLLATLLLTTPCEAFSFGAGDCPPDEPVRLRHLMRRALEIADRTNNNNNNNKSCIHICWLCVRVRVFRNSPQRLADSILRVPH